MPLFLFDGGGVLAPGGRDDGARAASAVRGFLQEH
jgi:hypothetical protein